MAVPSLPDTFDAFIIEEQDGARQVGFAKVAMADLPDHDVLVEVACSSVNYKDGLAVTGRSRISRLPRMIGGIDLAGRVIQSRSPAWQPGDRVMVNGWGLSETDWGGFSRFQRLKPEWLMRLPERFSFEQAMAIGTAGYTAALCVDALETANLTKGEAVVTGAAGGVGSFAIALLAQAGWTVTASTGRTDEQAYLTRLGAAAVVDRSEFSAGGRPFQKERWIAGVDSVGGVTLANVLAQTCYGGGIAACGLAGSAELPGSVLPFILRGVTLFGIDSVMTPWPRRAAAWERLARDLDDARLQRMYELRAFSDLPEAAAEIIAGSVRGRIVIEIGAG